MHRIFCSLLAVSLLGGVAHGDTTEAKIHAGIEIGGRGVKATVVEGRSGGLYRRLFAETHNTKLSVLKDGAFSKAAIKDTADAIAVFIKTISAKYKLSPARIVVVGSSGVPKASNRDALIAAVKKVTGKDLRFIDDRAEVELTILGVVPKDDRVNSISLDIGSGNTKGGYKPAGGALVYVAVPLGTVTFTQRITQEAKVKEISFIEAAARLRQSDLVAPLAKGAKEMPELPKRKRVYLSGGMVWAMVTLIRPEEVDKPYVTFSAKDVDAFLALVTKKAYPAPDSSKIADPERKQRAEKEMKNVRSTYTHNNLIAGAEILSGLVQAFDLKDKTLIFPRNGFVGWLAAYIADEKLDDPTSKRKE